MTHPMFQSAWLHPSFWSGTGRATVQKVNFSHYRIQLQSERDSGEQGLYSCEVEFRVGNSIENYRVGGCWTLEEAKNNVKHHLSQNYPLSPASEMCHIG